MTVPVCDLKTTLAALDVKFWNYIYGSLTSTYTYPVAFLGD
jgi:hypothetical protein